MRQPVELIKHTGILMSMELSLKLLEALVAVILARYLAPQGYGLMAFALSFASLFNILAGFGMGALSARDLAREPQRLSQYLANGLIARTALASLTLALIWALTRLMGYPSVKTWLVMLAGLLMVLEANVVFALSFFQAAQRMGTMALVNLAVRVGWVIGSLVIVWLNGGIAALLGVRVVATVAGLISAVALIDRRLQKIRWMFEPAFMWRMVTASFPFAMSRLYGTLYTDLATVMLSMMRGDAMTGWYAAATKLLRAFAFIPTGFSGAVLPAMSRSWQDSQADLARTIAASCKYLVIVALPIAGGLCVLADQVIWLLYGSAYQAAASALRVLSWSLPLQFLNSAMLAAIAAVNRERQGSVNLIVGALFSGLGNLLIIPHVGYLGAAATTLLAEALILTLQVKLLRGALPSLDLAGQMAKPLLATAAMMAFAWVSRPVGLGVAIVGSAAVYVAGLLATRAIGPHEFREAKFIHRTIRPLKMVDERA